MTVAMNGNLLRENTDYTVTYKNNVYPEPQQCRSLEKDTVKEALQKHLP